MARLPISGQDSGVWGNILNEFLQQSLTESGELKNSAVSSAVSDASTSTKGVVQLAGDFAGSATAPVVANGAITGSKIAATTITDSNIAASAAIAQSKVANLTTDLNAKLTATNNLSDVDDVAAARTNLSVPEASGFATITVGTTAPTSPAIGDVWIDTN